jgi:hypothetical protein
MAQYSCPPRDIKASDEAEGVKIEGKGCERQGKKVVCVSWLTATEDDMTIALGRSGDNGSSCWIRPTRLVDSSGDEYIPVKLQVGSKEVVGTREPSYPNGFLEIRLTKDVPAKVITTYADIPSSVDSVALLELGMITNGYCRDGGKKFFGKLRNLKILAGTGNSNSTTTPAPPAKKKK